jgi:hypothetical protein
MITADDLTLQHPYIDAALSWPQPIAGDLLTNPYETPVPVATRCMDFNVTVAAVVVIAVIAVTVRFIIIKRHAKKSDTTPSTMMAPSAMMPVMPVMLCQDCGGNNRYRAQCRDSS